MNSDFLKLRKYGCQMFSTLVAAGFPSPAEDYMEGKLDLNAYLVKNPSATFFVRAAGDSMLGAGIHAGDILIVDRSLEVVNKKIVVAVVNGEFTVKRIFIADGGIVLMPENKKYKPLHIKKEMNFEVWGVVKSVIHFL